jgi:hypothetical protein
MKEHSWYFIEEPLPHGSCVTIYEQGGEICDRGDKCIHTFSYTSDADSICRAHNTALEKALESQKLESLAEKVVPYFVPRDSTTLEHVLQPQPPAVLGLDGRLKYFIPAADEPKYEPTPKPTKVKLKRRKISV